ncbi:hypothetical protein CLPUN_35650 [Clostridium puniceum]|uniref:ERCC4 domain-containing protein n=1 Tax=Clostridium puniceum TaxID=29367 RepID=A0A1S8TBL3_9CLOT|nr:ERCC4 domain-containing protein [Clostridium puniceum]OOM75128.1 hypothetical protein CLPUN_35650 [Clostridium puniceum]
MRYRFTKTEVDKLLKNIVILVDTREQENFHITSWFAKNKIKFKVQKLDYGDYSAMLPAGTFKGQLRDIYFTDEIIIERKFCIDELAMNLKDKKTNINEIKQEIIDLLGVKYLEKVLKSDYIRIKHELANLNRYNIKFLIFIEDENFIENIWGKNYRADYAPSTLNSRIEGLQAEANTAIVPIAKKYMGVKIHGRVYYEVRNILVHKGFIEEIPDNEELLSEG